MLAQLFSEKALLLVITVVGMAVCTAGIGPVAAKGQWLQPLSIVGSVLGVLILGLVGAGLFDIKLPLIDSTRAAWIAVIVLIVVKAALTQLHQAIA